MISVEDVSLHFGGIKAVDGTSFTIKQGSVTGLIGPNGAGKTTLLQILTGKVATDCGQVYVNDAVKIGYVTQGLAGFYSSDIFLHNFLQSEYSESEVRQFLGAAKLRRDKVLQPVHTLSYGEQMRGPLCD